VRLRHNVVVRKYFAQDHSNKVLDASPRMLDDISRAANQGSCNRHFGVRLLSGLPFSSRGVTIVFKPLGVPSGGERNRLRRWARIPGIGEFLLSMNPPPPGHARQRRITGGLR